MLSLKYTYNVSEFQITEILSLLKASSNTQYADLTGENFFFEKCNINEINKSYKRRMHQSINHCISKMKVVVSNVELSQ